MIAQTPISEAELRHARHALFGFDAIESQNKRKTPTALLRSEDSEATDLDRRKLNATTRDTRRNFTIAAWMIRMHLAYVCDFKFKGTTENKALNAKLETIVNQRSARENFERTGRHPRLRAMRISEACRTVDGDILQVRLNDRRLQMVEGDRIRVQNVGDLPSQVDLSKVIHGVITDGAGRALAYCVNRRLREQLSALSGSVGAGWFVFERMVKAENAYLHGYFDRADQVRGVSPLTTALNELRDTYEALDLARAKLKVSQLFALAIYRKAVDTDADAPTQSTLEDGTGYQVDFGRGPTMLDLDPGDDAKILESGTPAIASQNFIQLVIAIALKALDIPYSFYAENFTNYSGSRGARLDYQRLAEPKREDNRELLNWWANWQFVVSQMDGELPGVNLADLRWTWIASGLPWIDPLKEILAKKEEVALGVNSRTRICAERGFDFEEDILPELVREAKLLSDAGLPLNANTDNALIAAMTQDGPANADSTNQNAA